MLYSQLWSNETPATFLLKQGLHVVCFLNDLVWTDLTMFILTGVSSLYISVCRSENTLILVLLHYTIEQSSAFNHFAHKNQFYVYLLMKCPLLQLVSSLRMSETHFTILSTEDCQSTEILFYCSYSTMWRFLCSYHWSEFRKRYFCLLFLNKLHSNSAAAFHVYVPHSLCAWLAWHESYFPL